MTKISNQYSLTNVLTADPVNGRVGIGTASPAYLLDVYSTTAARVQIQGTTNFSALQYTNTSGSFYVGIDDSAGANFTGTAYGRFLYSAGAYPMVFLTNATERMRITSGGSLLINRTTNPFESTYKLIINNGTNLNIGFGKQGDQMSIESFNDAVTVGNPLRIYASPLIVLGGNVGIGTASPATASGSFTSLDIRGSTGASLIMGSTATLMSYVYVNTAGLAIETTGTIPILFNPAGTERMRITSAGVVLIGATTANNITGAGSLQVNKEIISVGTSSFVGFQNRASTNFFGLYGDTNIIVYNQNIGTIGTFNATSGSYTPVSDINKKKDFEKSNIGLNEVLQLKPTLYRMKADDEYSRKELGFIAQEVNELIPQAYVETGEGEDKFIGLNQMPLIAALTKAIQDQQTQINELKALLNA